jgi:hypothetical protein
MLRCGFKHRTSSSGYDKRDFTVVTHDLGVGLEWILKITVDDMALTSARRKRSFKVQANVAMLNILGTHGFGWPLAGQNHGRLAGRTGFGVAGNC